MSAPEVGLAPGAARYGEIYDRGYRHYDGPRLGRGHAIWALVLYSMKRAVGIKKGWTSKIIPIVLYVGVSLPVIVSIGISAFLPNVDVLGYPGFFGLVFVLEGLFVATIAPEMLCGDRRENVLALYFSRAITRADYLLGKLVATALLTMTMSLVPAVVLWLGRQLLADAPLTAMRDNLGDLGRITIVGLLVAFYLGAIGLLISSFTGRKSIAVAVIVIGFLISTSLAYALFAAVEGDSRRYFIFLSPSDTVAGLTAGVFDVDRFDTGEFVGIADFPARVYAAVMAGVVLLACGIMYWRYVPNE